MLGWLSGFYGILGVLCYFPVIFFRRWGWYNIGFGCLFVWLVGWLRARWLATTSSCWAMGFGVGAFSGFGLVLLISVCALGFGAFSGWCAAVGLLLAVFAWDFGFVGVGGGFWVAALMVLGGLGFAACLCCCFGMGMFEFFCCFWVLWVGII